MAHNGTTFDYFVFAHKYRIAIGNRVFDTLIAQQRIFPDVEKSLGHCVSYWTYEPYHKNEAVHSYRNSSEAEKLWQYCGKDVYTMILVKEAQLAYAKTVPGLMDSINQAMASIKPYLICSLLGINFDEDARQAWIAEGDRLLAQ